MIHFVEYCKFCGKIITQCKCPSESKEIRMGTCADCKESRSHMVQLTDPPIRPPISDESLRVMADVLSMDDPEIGFIVYGRSMPPWVTIGSYIDAIRALREHLGMEAEPE